MIHPRSPSELFVESAVCDYAHLTMPRPSEALRSLARLGAEQRILQLRAEAEEIFRQFPDLRSGGKGTSNDGAAASRRQRRGMSAAQRKAVSARMKKYWAARRAAKSSKQ